jgi:EmrB/QacA subfamily drug resistance transporter
VATTEAVRYGTPAGRWILIATVLGSGMAALDATVVNVALPAIGKDLGAAISGLQWVLTGYLITLAALILLGGSLGDIFGRRRVFQIGVVWFSVASVLCGLAPNLPLLIGARTLQGVGGALLTPGSLAIIEASFAPDDRGRAIGAWSGMGGIATAIGPFAGGWLVSAVSWRLIFLLNVPLAAAVLWSSRRVPESVDPDADRRVDTTGAVLVVIGLAAVTFALIQGSASGTPPVLTALMAAIGVAALVGFVVVERSSSHPMVPLDIFSSRVFVAANLVTVAVYGALGGTFFLLAVDLQQVLHYSPLLAGAALIPVTVVMLFLSARAGHMAQRIGPRLPMTLGPLIVALALVMMRRIAAGQSYWSGVFPEVVIFGLGLSLTVAPLTVTVLAAVPERHAGVASGTNNAVARAASLLTVAVLPPLARITGSSYRHPAAFSAGFHRACLITAGLCAAGAAIAWVGIREPERGPPVPAAPPAAPRPVRRPQICCPIDGPPLRRA